jgi:threonine synthase
MLYMSTRGQAPELEFGDVLLAGLASDGGLYIPKTWPPIEVDESWTGLTFPQVVARMMAPYVEPTFTTAETLEYCEEVYAGFRHPDVAPITRLGEEGWLLELFWGPTLSFKDFALQLIGKLLNEVLERRDTSITVIGATSGDTGSAAIAALAGQSRVNVTILHPEGRVSEVQRRQMTTVDDPNVQNLAVRGSFDDCQEIVKQMFADESLREELGLSAVNSINWARIAAQAAYYAWAVVKTGNFEAGIAVAVPSGNFGNAYSAYVAKAMGVPIQHIVVGTNVNNRLATFLSSGRLTKGEVQATITPAMDIMVPSNLERLLFDMVDQDAAALRELMDEYEKTGQLRIDPDTILKFQSLFSTAWLTDDTITAAIADIQQSFDKLVDPHSAVGITAGRIQHRKALVPLVAVATAHPAKFPEAVESAVGTAPSLPADLADLFERQEQFDVVDADLETVVERVRSFSSK